MRHSITYISCLLICLLSVCQATAQSASKILDSASKMFSNSKSISATFALIDNGHSQNGSIIIAGNKFVINTPQLSTWFDGKTQWSYSPQANEVNIINPTAEEVRQINPFAIISDFRSNFNEKKLNSTKGTHKILLTSKNNQPIRNVELTLDASTHLPLLIVITAKNNTKATIKIKTIKAGDAVNNSTFIFNEKKYPGVEIVDLR